MQQNPFPNEISSYKRELVGAVQNLFSKGLSKQIIKNCIRIDNSFESFSGGLKSKLVGGMQINLNAVLKLGDSEMLLHQILMNSVNEKGVIVFPEVLTCFKSEHEYLLLMENLTGFESLHNLVFKRNTSLFNLSSVTRKAFALLSCIHSMDDLPSLTLSKNPFYSRIQSKICAAIEADCALRPLWERSGKILGSQCPPLSEVFPVLEKWLENVSESIPRTLVHGDPHLANIMVRKRGKGHSVRFIDPNPLIGIATPFYDFGKILHWASEVGWAKAYPMNCTCSFRPGKNWALSPKLTKYSKSAESRRQHVYDEIHRNISPFLTEQNAQPLLHISTASAHVGLVSLYHTLEQKMVRRYVLAYALRELGLAYSLINRKKIY